MAGSISWLYPNHQWGKPLNPILGETYQATMPDGSVVYCEQVCHHPPISYILMEGPDGLFRYSGYADIAIKAYINSINLEVKGNKVVQFKDGGKIVFGNQQDTFGNTLFGKCHHFLYG